MNELERKFSRGKRADSDEDEGGLKILYCAFNCHPEQGGEAGNGWNFPLEIARQGHRVWCLTQESSRKAIEAHRAEYEDLDLTFCYVPVPRFLDRLWSNLAGMYLYYIIWQRLAYGSARKLHRQHHFDIAHHIVWGSIQLGTFIWKLDAPFVYGPLGGGQTADPRFKKYFGSDWSRERKREWVSEFLIRFFLNTKAAVRNARVVLATNLETRDLAQRLGARQTRMMTDFSLPAGLPPQDYPERKESGILRVLWVGRLMPRKAVRLVLDALSKVDPTLDFMLTIVGGGQQEDELPGWISDLGLESRVQCEGQVPFTCLPEYYSSHDLFMFCPLRESSASQFLEAQAFGLPVLTLDLHGGKLMVPDDCGIKVAAADPSETVEALASAVERLHRNPGERIRLGKNAFRHAAGQTWPLKVREIERIYGDILNPA